ncbi:MAG TPA: hypothetical protein EYO94_05825 [Acidobacteria bacterium]|jgi:uncharacterized protein YciI|nr:hypothetical protein [Acidobacteriota bacterium]HIM15810.1 hypothetical protein [Acidobacteriota bacterium]
MPLYALIARDRPGLEHRQTNRPAHLEHMAKLDAAGRIRYGGPLVNDSHDMVGSLIIIEAESLDDAKATYAKDPYVIHNVFEQYEVVETMPVFPRGN